MEQIGFGDLIEINVESNRNIFQKDLHKTFNETSPAKTESRNTGMQAVLERPSAAKCVVLIGPFARIYNAP